MTRAHARLAAAGALLRAHPRHALLAAFVSGLAARGAGERIAATLLVVAAIAVAVAARARPRGLLVVGAVALLAGCAVADLRLAAIDRSGLGDWIGRGVALRATTTEPSRPPGPSGRARVVVAIGPGALPRERIGVLLPRGVHVRAGRGLLLRGRLVALDARDGALRRRGAKAVLLARRAARTARRRGGFYGAVDRVRDRADAALARGLAPPRAALARGMALGDDSALAPSVRDHFRASGLAHLLAASGQNVALLCALALAIGAATGMPRRARLALALALVTFYVPLAGGGPSILRAGAMGAATLVAALAGRPASRAYALLLAAAVTLVADPRATSDPGWQLSFAAVLAIAALAQGWARRLRDHGTPTGLAEAAALTAAATVGTAPLVAFHFDRVSLVSLPANVLAAVAVVPIVWLATLAGTIGQVSQVAGGFVASLASLPLAFVAALARSAAALPAAELPVRLGSPVVLVATYGLLAVLVASRRLRGPALVVAVPLLVAVLAAARAPPPPDARTLVVSFLDVGQGDATLLQHHGTTVLIDAGPPAAPLLARLREAGVRRVDLFVVTHAQADHNGNAAEVVRALPVGLVFDGGLGVARSSLHADLVAAIREGEVRVVAPDAGQVLRVGPFVVRVLWPRAELAIPALRAGADPNEHPTVLHIRDGRFDLLAPADAESDVTSPLDLPQDVEAMKVAHHGSADPGLAETLARVRPRVSVIELGDRNPYGHPAPQALQALTASGTVLRRTDRDGTVRLLVRGNRMELTTSR